jgi:hypothetical protein
MQSDSPAKTVPKDDETDINVVRVQANWKRRPGIATRYELEQAIQRLLLKGKIVIVDGRLSLPQRGERGEIRMRLALTGVGKTDEERRRARWAKEDDELRAYCQRMEVHASTGKRVYELTEMQSTFDVSANRGSPRPGVAKYVLRELRTNGPTGYESLIDAVFGEGGYEWVFEEPQRTYRKADKATQPRRKR